VGVFEGFAERPCRERFFSRWVKGFGGIRDLDGARAKFEPYGFLRKFPDGSWVIGGCSSLDSGESCNAAVLQDNSGALYMSDHWFSGQEGMNEELTKIPAVSADAFYRSIDRYKFVKRKRN